MFGTVKFFKSENGYGFIQERGTNQEYFVHISGTTDKLNKNDEVEFEVEQGKKGPIAVKVRKVGVAA